MYIKEDVDGLQVLAFTSISCGVDYIITHCLHTKSSAIALNPEKILQAKENPEARKILESASFLYPDGIGVVKVLEKKTNLRIPRIPGCDLWEQLMKRAGKDNIPVYLLGAKNEVLQNTVSKLKNDYGTIIVGCRDGYSFQTDELINEIKESGAKIISVALGSPRQEKFINQCMEANISAFFMGVGGTYDVYSGYVKRAPSLVRGMNLEWAYRLASKPSRIFRQTRLLKYTWLYITKQL